MEYDFIVGIAKCQIVQIIKLVLSDNYDIYQPKNDSLLLQALYLIENFLILRNKK